MTDSTQTSPRQAASPPARLASRCALVGLALAFAGACDVPQGGATEAPIDDRGAALVESAELPPEPTPEELASLPTIEQTELAPADLAAPADGTEALPAGGGVFEGEPPLEQIEAQADVGTDERDPEIVGGRATYARPEIGWIDMFRGNLRSRCTATLVAPTVVLSAAHCVHYWTVGQPPDPGYYFGTFNIRRVAGGRVYRYGIKHFKSFSRTTGAADLAVLQLGIPVSSRVARPAALAARRPSVAPMRAWGYGCDRRGEREFGTKRYRDFTYGGSHRSRLLCPGDSGGPGTLRANNQIALVHSAYYTASGIDIFADPVRYRAAILDWMRFYRLYP